VPRLLLALAGAFALAGCAGGGTETVSVTETRTETQTKTEFVTETFVDPIGLPTEVAQTHFALLEAAESGDYELLRPLVPGEFSYTFGRPGEGPIEYWQQVEADTDESPIEILARLLRLPYTLSSGTYVWPFAFDKTEDELTRHERRLLGDLAAFSGAGGGYLGWRAGIAPDGTWRFFIAGD
jgi:hypothetical protein